MRTLNKVAAGLFILAAIVTFSGVPTWAHRSKTVFTIAELDRSSNIFEITHQIHLHDAQTALNQLKNDRTASLFDIEEQAWLLLHVAEDFDFTVDGIKPEIAPIGAEIDGDHIYLYFETEPVTSHQKINVRHDIFYDAFPDQINQINIDIDPIIRTLIFREKGKDKTAIF